MPGKKKLETGTETESPTKKTKPASDSLMSSLSAGRQATAANIREFSRSQAGSVLASRVREVSGDRGRLLRECKGVAYWMWRDRRVQDNWALLYAQKMALELNVPLHVVCCVPPAFGEMTMRHYTFMLEGLKEVAEECAALHISFHLLAGSPPALLTRQFLASHQIGLLVADFSPLRQPRAWLDQITASLKEEGEESVHQVDAHNIVPVLVTSDKQEYAARTIRTKINKKLSDYLTEFPPVVEHPVVYQGKVAAPDTKAVYESLTVDREGWGLDTVEEFFSPGTTAGLENLQQFVEERLKQYGSSRNDPNAESLSNMSPWANMGQVSMQRAVLYVRQHGKKYPESVAAFVEEAVVRRELSDNFCYFNPDYDSVTGATTWAQKTLEDHRKDKREFLYSREQLEQARTHDDLWNASQLQLVREGKLHGFLRMYWAKKVLEWTSSPEEALAETLRLNDRFALDGNNPNGKFCLLSVK